VGAAAEAVAGAEAVAVDAIDVMSSGKPPRPMVALLSVLRHRQISRRRTPRAREAAACRCKPRWSAAVST
jgi:hypothetical protein